MTGLTFDFPRIAAFVQALLPGLALQEGMRGIGWERDGQLQAGVLYEGFNGPNIWMHVAAVDGRAWLRRKFLRACFAYPFNVCGVERVWGWVEASNSDAQRFNEHLGFRRVTVLPGAAPDGGDVLVYCMERHECRWLGGVKDGT